MYCRIVSLTVIVPLGKSDGVAVGVAGNRSRKRSHPPGRPSRRLSWGDGDHHRGLRLDEIGETDREALDAEVGAVVLEAPSRCSGRADADDVGVGGVSCPVTESVLAFSMSCDPKGSKSTVPRDELPTT